MAWNHILGLTLFLSMPLAGITIMACSAVQDWRRDGRSVADSRSRTRDSGLLDPRPNQPHQEIA